MILDLGGTTREVNASETIARLEPLLLKEFGITRVADVTGLDVIGIPVCMSIRPNSKTLSVSQGKGITKELAIASALMESVELWHSENTPPPAFICSYNQLKKIHAVIDIDPLLISSFGYLDVYDRDIAWIECQDLITKQILYAPFALINLDDTARRPGQHLFSATSNGLASGNSLSEAICYSLFELIERDCEVDKVNFTAQQNDQHRVIIDSIQSAHNKHLLDHLKKSNMDIYIWDITNRYGIPAYHAEIDDVSHVRDLGLFAGMGCHLSKEVALSRAITEAIQSRLTLISGARDDMLPSTYSSNQARHPNYSTIETIDFNQTHNEPLPDSFAGYIEKIIHHLTQQGIKTIAMYNHTQDHLQIPVVHVIIPGLNFEWQTHRMAKPL